MKTQNALGVKKIGGVVGELPTAGESIHIVSNGCFDYFSLVPWVLNTMQASGADLWFSTWTMNFANVARLFECFDAGQLKTISALTGLYFATREKAVYAELCEGLAKRGQRIYANKNHSKVTLIRHGESHFVIEGSANFTANPRIENFVLSNSKPLFDFHRDWLEELLARAK